MLGAMLGRVSHRSMFKDNSCPPELVLFAASVFRRLTGILEDPGIVRVRKRMRWSERVAQKWNRYFIAVLYTALVNLGMSQ